MVADIKNDKLGWIEHVERMDHGRIINKVFESKLEGSRRSGRPS
jgi:hypothetical protein